MRTKTASVLLGVLLTAAGATGALASARSLSTEVTLTPASKPGAYLAAVEISDSASQEVLSAPSISFMKGEPVNTSTKLSTGESVLFSIEVDSLGKSATYSAEIRQDGKLIASQKATIALAQ